MDISDMTLLESVKYIFKGFQTLEVPAKREFRKHLLSIVLFSETPERDAHSNTYL